MGSEVFKYEITDEMIDKIIQSALNENYIKEKLKVKQRVFILLRGFFYVVVIAVFIFWVSVLVRAIMVKVKVRQSNMKGIYLHEKNDLTIKPQSLKDGFSN